ncbi:EAL domain-containing protein [Alkalihalobacillus oceani]|nr:EAL domain-containing protein [Halalkalibacter oceani]
MYHAIEEDEHFINFVKKTLEETNFPPSLLNLEITENILMTNIQTARQMINRLKELGIQISIDDFGTGYSSLSYLRQFQIDHLKIDKGFVSEKALDKVIVKSVIDLGHNLNLKVDAEGVEDEKQLTYLQSIGCDVMQGYYFSRPLSEKEFTNLIV